MINPILLNFLTGVFATLGTVAVGYFTFRGTKIKTKAESKVAEVDRANEQLIALTQERTKLLERSNEIIESQANQIEKSNHIIEAQSEQLKIYKKQTALFQEQIAHLEKTIKEVTKERDELSQVLKKAKQERGI
jgi:chromosome segregation ATPase